MPKLNQIVAVVAGKKTRIEKEIGDLNKLVQKSDLFHGLSRQYQPIADGGEQLPPEAKYPQLRIADLLQQARNAWTDTMDAIATQETGNTGATANIIVDGVTILHDVPVTVLLYLEKQLNDLNTFIGNLPTLDPAERWTLNQQTGEYTTEPIQTSRTKKVQKPIVMYDATKEHPAQTQLITEDVTAGHWTTTKSASVISAAEKRSMLDRVHKLQEAVKIAREDANSIDVPQITIGAPVLRFIFGV